MKLEGDNPKMNSCYDLEIALQVYSFERAAITKFSQIEWLKQQMYCLGLGSRSP